MVYRHELNSHTWSSTAFLAGHRRQVLDLCVELDASVLEQTGAERPVERLQEEALHDVIVGDLAYEQRVEHVGQLTHLSDTSHVIRHMIVHFLVLDIYLFSLIYCQNAHISTQLRWPTLPLSTPLGEPTEMSQKWLGAATKR